MKLRIKLVVVTVRYNAATTISTSSSITIFISITTSHTIIGLIGLDQVNKVLVTEAHGKRRRSLTVVIVLSTFVLGRNGISSGVEFTSDLNVASSAVTEEMCTFDKVLGENTSSRGVLVSFKTKCVGTLFRLGNSFDVDLTVVEVFTTGAGR